jgi:hypothetical protein
VKLAVTLTEPVIVRFCGLVVPLKAPEKPENKYPLAGVAVIWTCVPALYAQQGGLNVRVPVPAGLTLVVSWYCVAIAVKLAVSVIALFKVTVRGFAPLFMLPVNPLNW